MQVTLKNSDLSDCDSYEPSDQAISENFNEAQSSINQRDTLSSRAGVSWKRISDKVNRGRASGKNIFLKDRDQHLFSKNCPIKKSTQSILFVY